MLWGGESRTIFARFAAICPDSDSAATRYRDGAGKGGTPVVTEQDGGVASRRAAIGVKAQIAT